jgi:hypothetical protein
MLCKHATLCASFSSYRVMRHGHANLRMLWHTYVHDLLYSHILGQQSSTGGAGVYNVLNWLDSSNNNSSGASPFRSVQPSLRYLLLPVISLHCISPCSLTSHLSAAAS